MSLSCITLSSLDKIAFTIIIAYGSGNLIDAGLSIWLLLLLFLACNSSKWMNGSLNKLAPRLLLLLLALNIKWD